MNPYLEEEENQYDKSEDSDQNDLYDESQKDDNSTNNPYKGLCNRLDCIKATLYDEPVKSLTGLIDLCDDFCSKPNNKDKYDNVACFIDSSQCIYSMVFKYQPENAEAIYDLFNNFTEEDNQIREKSDSDSYYDNLFEHYQRFVNDLRPKIEEITYNFPKYMAKPIDLKYLFIIDVLIILLYIIVRYIFKD